MSVSRVNRNAANQQAVRENPEPSRVEQVKDFFSFFDVLSGSVKPVEEDEAPTDDQLPDEGSSNVGQNRGDGALAASSAGAPPMPVVVAPAGGTMTALPTQELVETLVTEEMLAAWQGQSDDDAAAPATADDLAQDLSDDGTGVLGAALAGTLSAIDAATTPEIALPVMASDAALPQDFVPAPIVARPQFESVATATNAVDDTGAEEETAMIASPNLIANETRDRRMAVAAEQQEAVAKAQDAGTLPAVASPQELHATHASLRAERRSEGRRRDQDLALPTDATNTTVQDATRMVASIPLSGHEAMNRDVTRKALNDTVAQARDTAMLEMRGPATAVQAMREQLSVQHQVRDGLQPLIKGNQERVEIQLAPPEWGAVEVRLRLDEGKVHLGVRADHQFVKDAIEAGLPGLRAAFQEAGLSIVDVRFSAGEQAQWEGGFHNQQFWQGAFGDGRFGEPGHGEGQGTGTLEGIGEPDRPRADPRSRMVDAII